MTRAYIFGGSGFIGRHLTESLVSNGIPVTICDLRRPREASPLVDYQEVDVRRPIDFTPSPSLNSVIYNLAAVHRTPGHRDHEYYETNVLGATNVTAWAGANQIERVCFTSSIAVYGPSEEPKTESSTLQPNTAYGRSKLLAEQIHQSWRNETPARQLVVVRPAVIFGPGEDGNFSRLAAALRRGRFFFPGRDDTAKACGYISDLVRAIHFGLQQDGQEVLFNYCYPHNYSIREICAAFHSVAGYAMPRMLPRVLIEPGLSALRLAGRMDAKAGTFAPSRIAKLTVSSKIEPMLLRSAGFEWKTDLDSALRDWYEADPRGQFV